MNIMNLQLVIHTSYFIAAILFIFGLQRMSSPVTARNGIVWAGAGMVLATLVTFLYPGMSNFILMLVAIGLGGIIAWISGKKVEMTEQGLSVPNNVKIPFIEGDGIGADIWAASSNVFNSAVEKAYGGERSIEWVEVLAGEKAFNSNGEWLPQETLDTILDHKIAIKGPLTTPIGGGIRSLNVALRQKLDLYACVRPVRWFSGVPSPVKEPAKVDMVIFRENTEDIYAGIEFKAESEESKKIVKTLEDDFGIVQIRFPDVQETDLALDAMNELQCQ